MKVPVVQFLLGALVAATALPSSANSATKEFERHRCVSADTFQIEVLSYGEACKYRKEGCLQHFYRTKKKMYCAEELLSGCFERKAWKTEHEIFALPEAIEIGRVSRSISIGMGERSEKLCAYYDIE